MLICKVYNFSRVIISAKLNQTKHMTPSSYNPCQKLFNAIWIFSIEHDLGFKLHFEWLGVSLQILLEIIYSFDFHDVTPLSYWNHWDLPQNTRPSNWNMFQPFNLYSKLEKINKHQTIWIFLKLMKLDFFFQTFFFLNLKKKTCS
jgi:hypothetical protein